MLLTLNDLRAEGAKLSNTYISQQLCQPYEYKVLTGGKKGLEGVYRIDDIIKAMERKRQNIMTDYSRNKMEAVLQTLELAISKILLKGMKC